MALYVQLHYEDGATTPVAAVPVEEGDDSVLVVVPSVDNGVVAFLEIHDEADQLVARTAVDLFLRVTDKLQVMVVPPTDGWPPAAYFSKDADEVAAMRLRLQAMAARLRDHDP